MTPTEQTTEKKSKRKKTATYHEAAFAAFNYLLRKYKHNGDVELFDEHRLSKRSLKIDIMVVKKNPAVEIEESWGKIFREHNVIEYKSPVAKPVSLDVFNKVIHGYTGIYASNENISLTQMTATIVCFKKPTALFEQLKSELNYKILRKDKGIYYISIKGSCESKSLLIQFLVSDELEDSVVVLKALRAKIDETTAKKVLELPVEDDEYQVSLSQWWEVMLLENREILSEEENMGRWEDVVNTLERKGILDKWSQKKKQDWQREGMQQGMQKMLDLLKNGISIADAEKMILAR